MEGLSQLLADLVPTQLNTLAHWHSTKKKHADFDDVMRALIAKAEGDQKQAEFQRKGKGTSSFTGGKAGRGRSRGGRSGGRSGRGRTGRGDMKQPVYDEEGNKLCFAMLTYGNCKFGDDCEYSHDIPSSHGGRGAARAGRAARQQTGPGQESARVVIAEAEDTEEAVMLMEDNCRLRHRIAELEGGLCGRVQAEQHADAESDTVIQPQKPQCRVCVTGQGHAQASSNESNFFLNFSETSTRNCSDSGRLPNKEISANDSKQGVVCAKKK